MWRCSDPRVLKLLVPVVETVPMVETQKVETGPMVETQMVETSTMVETRHGKHRDAEAHKIKMREHMRKKRALQS